MYRLGEQFLRTTYRFVLFCFVLFLNLGQAVVADVVPSPPWYVPSFLSAQGSALPLLVDFHGMLITHALALSANQFFMQEKIPARMCAR